MIRYISFMNPLLTSIMVAIPAGIVTKSDVCSSNKYKNITI